MAFRNFFTNPTQLFSADPERNSSYEMKHAPFVDKKNNEAEKVSQIKSSFQIIEEVVE